MTSYTEFLRAKMKVAPATGFEISDDEIKIRRMRDIRDRWGAMIDGYWDREIKPFFLAPAKPAGLDNFLEEIGL